MCDLFIAPFLLFFPAAAKIEVEYASLYASWTLIIFSSHMKGAFRRTKKQQYLSQIHVFFDKIFLTKIKTRKSFKTGSENSQKAQEKLTNT